MMFAARCSLRTLSRSAIVAVELLLLLVCCRRGCGLDGGYGTRLQQWCCLLEWWNTRLLCHGEVPGFMGFEDFDAPHGFDGDFLFY